MLVVVKRSVAINTMTNIEQNDDLNHRGGVHLQWYTRLKYNQRQRRNKYPKKADSKEEQDRQALTLRK